MAACSEHTSPAGVGQVVTSMALLLRTPLSLSMHSGLMNMGIGGPDLQPPPVPQLPLAMFICVQLRGPPHTQAAFGATWHVVVPGGLASQKPSPGFASNC